MSGRRPHHPHTECVLEEGEEDGEYNYLAESHVVEKEELRNDRAVKIPRE